MVQILLFLGTLFILFLVIEANSNTDTIGRPCCTCTTTGRPTINMSYTDCVNNHTCRWICDNPILKKCATLFLDPGIKEGPPNVTSLYKTFNKVEDEELEIPCKILSNPEANLTWLFNGRDIYSYPDKRNRFSNQTKGCVATLKTMILLPSDEGSYTCLAKNAKGSGNKAFTVTVERKPTVIPRVIDLGSDTDEPSRAYLGTTFNLSCQVNFNPNVIDIPQISFFRHGEMIRDIKGKYENFPQAKVDGSLQTRKLSLKNVTIEEQGNWSCRGTKAGVKGHFRTLYLQIVPCPAGYFCPWDEGKKHECPYGTYNDGSTNITYQCTKCPGEYPPTQLHDYYVRSARSVAECPTKGKSPSSIMKYIIIGLSTSSLVVFLLICTVFKLYKRKSMNFRNERVIEAPFTQEDSHLALVAHDGCSYETGIMLCNSAGAAVTQEFPVEYDVFISYSSRDADFATEIQRELERQAFKCCIHIRDFKPGDTIINNISNAIYGSRVTLAILSPDFVESEWCKGELQQALTRSMRDHRVIPILYKTCQIPIELRHRTYIDYEKLYNTGYFWVQLTKALDNVKPNVESNLMTV